MSNKSGMWIRGLQEVQDALSQELKKLEGSHYALVGIHESAGVTDDEQMTMATLGAVQHFGNGQIPARRWLDTGAESGSKDIITTARDGLANGLDSKSIVAQMGAETEGAIKQYITDLKEPPNAPSTIRKKGSSNPLVDTGNMRASVTSVVVAKKPKEGLE